MPDWLLPVVGFAIGRIGQCQIAGSSHSHSQWLCRNVRYNPVHTSTINVSTPKYP